MNLPGVAAEIKRQERRYADGHEAEIFHFIFFFFPPHVGVLITAGGLHKPTARERNMQTAHIPVLEH